MTSERLIARHISELDEEYARAHNQLSGLKNTIAGLKKHADLLIKTGDFTTKPTRMSNEAWRKRASEMIKELMKQNKIKYPSANSVLAAIYKELRNSYGVVIDQLRKDFRYNNDTLRFPSAFEAISDNDTIREIFDSILLELFPRSYFEDEALIMSEGGEIEHEEESPENNLAKIILPLAIKRNDTSDGFTETFELICSNLNCAWNNLFTRYRKKNDTEKPPSKAEIIINNPNVFRKFKKSVSVLLDDAADL